MLMSMEVELLVVPDCPGERGALLLAKTALHDLGLEAPVVTTVITSHEEAVARGFVGSPTFLINGCDPFEKAGASVGVACRLYETNDGVAGLPTSDELRIALQEAGGD